MTELDAEDKLKAASIRGIDLISQKDGKDNSYYYLNNYHGDVVNLTDVIGNIVNNYSYDAFGNTLEANEQVHNRFRYSGEQFDPITNQYYLRARFYNPVVGRFTQEDEYRGDGLNLYAYVANNPVNYVDPSGYALTCEKKVELYKKYPNLYENKKAREASNFSGNKPKTYSEINPKYDPKAINKYYKRKVKGDLLVEQTSTTKKNSTILRDELKKAGIKTPTYFAQAHHIAPAKQLLTHVIEKLESFGIMRNSSANGVYLPTIEMKGNPQSIHSSTYKGDVSQNRNPGMMKHGPKYIKMVTDGIMNSNSRREALGFLNEVRMGLLDGSIDVYK